MSRARISNRARQRISWPRSVRRTRLALLCAAFRAHLLPLEGLLANLLAVAAAYAAAVAVFQFLAGCTIGWGSSVRLLVIPLEVPLLFFKAIPASMSGRGPPERVSGAAAALPRRGTPGREELLTLPAVSIKRRCPDDISRR